MDELDRITVNPAVMSGKPCIRGMRVTVASVLRLLAAGHTAQRILTAYPYLEPADINACISYAALRVDDEELCVPTA
ncbi:MAG: DUF433 domain-containing protein [Verrucomicrobia bacterium]|nr:DUF433 domain-containing protein [Verrucomicrobiota bacterium]